MSAVILTQRQLPRVEHKCARVVVSPALILTQLQTGGCARSLVAPTRRRATPILLAPSRARAHAAAPPAPCLLHGVARRDERGSLTLYSAARVPHSVPSRAYARGTTPASAAGLEVPVPEGLPGRGATSSLLLSNIFFQLLYGVVLWWSTLLVVGW